MAAVTVAGPIRRRRAARCVDTEGEGLDHPVSIFCLVFCIFFFVFLSSAHRSPPTGIPELVLWPARKSSPRASAPNTAQKRTLALQLTGNPNVAHGLAPLPARSLHGAHLSAPPAGLIGLIRPGATELVDSVLAVQLRASRDLRRNLPGPKPLARQTQQGRILLRGPRAA